MENETSFVKELSKQYIYLEIKDLLNGMYKKDNILIRNDQIELKLDENNTTF